MVIAARPTLYKGIQMRSRLEALYAAYLDEVKRLCWAPGGLGNTLGDQWSYEPDCYADESGQYLPDFKAPFLAEDFTWVWNYVEVKPTREQAVAALAGMHPVLSSDARAALTCVFNSGTYESPMWDVVAICCHTHPCGRCQR